MVHRERLTLLLVCCLALSLVAAQPAVAGDSETPMLFEDDADGLSHEDSGGETTEEDDTRDESGEETDSDDENSNWRDGSADRRWGEDSDDESDDGNSSDYRQGMEDSGAENESEEGNRSGSDGDAPDEQMDGSSEDAADEESEGDGRNSTARANESLHRFLFHDVADVLVGVTDVAPNGTAYATAAGADESSDAKGWPIDRGGDGDADDATLRPSTGLDRAFGEGDPDGSIRARGAIDGMTTFVATGGERGALTGIERFLTYVGSKSALLSDVVVVLVEPSDGDGDDQLLIHGDYEGTADGEALRPFDRPATLDGESPTDSSVDGAGDDGATDEAGAAGGSSGGDGGQDPAGAPAEGAALLMFVGYLGGGRLAVNQTAMLASVGQSNLVATLQQSLGHRLGELPDRIVPPVFGYSRHDESDPLENDTRARIYDLVRESPGMYYAQLAEETDVTVETVRYHCRILADEGLVERRKLRGRQRLYPVTMDDDDPELAAAIADSAASDVLSAIERREPTTLSSVADAIGCAPSTVSYHLDRLEEDGLVSRERDGGSVRIRLRRATKSALQGGVADD